MRTALIGSIAFLALAAPRSVEAQDGWWDWALRESPVRVEVGRRAVPRRAPDVVYLPSPISRVPARAPGVQRVRGGNGPAFCRSGAGHPVHGRRWCLEKGFGLGASPYGPAYHRVRWERRDDWRRALPVARRLHPLAPLGPRQLRVVLGPTVYGRLDRNRARLGGRAALSGRWIRPDGATLVLQIRSGPLAVAELTDYGADGLFDVVLVVGG